MCVYIYYTVRFIVFSLLIPYLTYNYHIGVCVYSRQWVGNTRQISLNISHRQMLPKALEENLVFSKLKIR